jgi:hypothetical protein
MSDQEIYFFHHTVILQKGEKMPDQEEKSPKK